MLNSFIVVYLFKIEFHCLKHNFILSVNAFLRDGDYYFNRYPNRLKLDWKRPDAVETQKLFNSLDFKNDF